MKRRDFIACLGLISVPTIALAEDKPESDVLPLSAGVLCPECGWTLLVLKDKCRCINGCCSRLLINYKLPTIELERVT